MRMWMIDPKLMCNQHLLGEHGELHKFIPSFYKKYKVTKRIEPIVQIELSSYQKRHDELAEEMLHRGMNHKSPLPELPDFSYLPDEHFNAKVDINKSIEDLKNRCRRCKDVMDRKI
tara:strand:- start:16042 stop:16389 length:348 start_codon:yes stop_codon:yes gene_type:complete